MVRLVFRPYTQIRRTICTSVSLRASTRVSPGFALLRHSSPSFGSQQICSYSNLTNVKPWSVGGASLYGSSSDRDSHHPLLKKLNKGLVFTFISHYSRVLSTQILAYMLDSLVRVSRRVDENHFVNITIHATTWYSTQCSCLWKHKIFCLFK